MVKALPNPSASRADMSWLEPARSCAPPETGGHAGGGEPKIAPRFPKASKLLRHADFQRVYKQGRRHFAAHITVFYLRREEGSGPRVGFTVGRVLGGAVERNRIKRRLREAVRYHLASLAVQVDVVINPKKSAQTAEFTVLKDEVARAFEKITSTVGSRRPTEGSQ